MLTRRKITSFINPIFDHLTNRAVNHEDGRKKGVFKRRGDRIGLGDDNVKELIV